MPVVIIKAITEDSILVNKKSVYRDQQNNWVACSELSSKERRAFENYNEAIIQQYGYAKGTVEYTF